jgi:predicted lipase
MYTHLLLLLILFASARAGSFDNPTIANVTQTLSEVAYCGGDADSYKSWTFVGDVSDFVVTHDIKGIDDVEGFVAYSDAYKMITVAYRGSHDAKNWILNLDAKKTACPELWGIEGCHVHEGFLKGEQDVISGVLDAVKSLQAKYSSYDVICTGHSLGAALATLTAMDLIASEVKKVSVWNFGSPRIGDFAFAQGASERLSVHRVTHHKDMVVHTPPMNMDFEHCSTEWYEDPTASVVECIGFEDPNCSDQWAIATSIDDHLTYMGLAMGMDGCDWVSQ